MSYAPASIPQAQIVGNFVEKEFGKTFEYAMATAFPQDCFRDYPHKVFVGPNGTETRFALVKKTVAYVVIDEDENGGLKVQKWDIKNHHRPL